MRPGLPKMVIDPDDRHLFDEIGGRHPGEDGKNYLTKEFTDRFDCVIIMHLPRWIVLNWEAIKHKPVIWRTIGQSISPVEQQLKPYRDQGMKIVRYSPAESRIPGFIGSDALIRFYKDPDEFKDWNGSIPEVMTLAQSMKQRGEFCGYEIFKTATEDIPRKLYGIGNEDSGIPGGKLSYDTLKQAMRDHGCYFYTGTHPASYTLNFMEALTTGMPMVALGPALGNSRHYPGHNLYEVAEILKEHDCGMVSDDIRELNIMVKTLLNNKQMADWYSKRARETAIELFGKEKISGQWDKYLKSI